MWVTATTRWEPCATILLQAALGPCGRGCFQGEGQTPGHPSQLHTPRTACEGTSAVGAWHPVSACAGTLPHSLPGPHALS